MEKDITKLYVALDVQERRKEVNQKYYAKKKLEQQEKFLEEARILASERNGKCISTEWNDSRTKMLWECSEGHRWMSLLSTIRAGSWCCVCYLSTKSYTLEDAQSIAKSKGGKCLSETLEKFQKHLEWECKKGHNWESTLTNINKGSWCKICSGKIHSLQSVVDFVEKKGCKCLTTEYSAGDKVLIECSEGHQFSNSYSNIRCNGQWCPECKSSPKRYTLADAQDMAKSNGGICLSDTFLNSKKYLQWECKKGHQWKSTLTSVKRGVWCKTCSGRKEEFFEEAKTVASEKHGKCISTEYKNSRTDLLWECSKGHQFLEPFKNIKAGKWCPICKPTRYTLEDAQNMAISHGGKCLSDTFLNSRNFPLQWECKKGHKWEAVLTSVIKGSWCKICSGITHNLQSIIDFVEQKGGKCLTTEYSIGDKVLIECLKGHQWSVDFHRLKTGNWCGRCGYDGMMDTLEDAQKCAEEKGGKCLSKEYLGRCQKMEWVCEKEHRWKAPLYSIKKGTWCPYCSKFRSEGACREIFESLFETKFPKKRPKFLGRLELDGYNKDLQLAFEYQGKQHYEYTPFFYKSKDDFKAQQKRDRQKYDLCIQNDITLILIPYKFDCHNIMKLETYIIDQCVSHGIKNEMETTINFID